MFCWRCGRTLNRTRAQLMVIDNTLVPVCRDDRSCHANVCGSKQKRKELIKKGLIA